jgi:hypothetical protein
MKYINTWPLFKESKFHGIDILPESALKQLEDYIDLDDKNTKVEVYPDPKVDGTYALRVYREDLTFDLLWYKNGFDEVDFTTWPPISGDLRFF